MGMIRLNKYAQLIQSLCRRRLFLDIVTYRLNRPRGRFSEKVKPFDQLLVLK